MKNRRKPEGVCKVDICDATILKIGLCAEHFEKMYGGNYKRQRNTGKASHPLRKVWGERHGYGSFPFEWMDFWKFVEDVGERPSENHYLYKIDRFRAYAKDNFKWVEHIRREPNETDKEWDARRWQQRLKIRPAMKEYGKNFRAFVKCGILKDPTHPLEEFSKFFLNKMEKQNNLCAICSKPETKNDNRNGVKKTKRLALDHCHKTMKIRDLLCEQCNLTLGRVEESEQLLQNMIKYLAKYKVNDSGEFYNVRLKIKLRHKMPEVCDICGKPETHRHFKNNTLCRLALDHCHKTNLTRGWLCQRCNTSLGRLEDSSEIIKSMIRYIKKHAAA